MTDPTIPVCPCDDHRPVAPTNVPGLNTIAFRAGTYREIRRALLTRRETEMALLDWRPGGQGDLGVMMVEWWAYLADILTFYNERIANQAYLRTADRPESVNRLIRVLGYRPRPAIGAHGVLAALVAPGKSGVLPKGQKFNNKPGPGQQVQTFELDADTPFGAGAVTPATPTRSLLWPEPDVLTLPGEVRGVMVGEALVLRAPDIADSVALRVTKVGPVIRPDRTRQTRVEVAFAAAPPSGARAVDFRLERPRQSSGLWSFVGSAIEAGDGNVLHLAGLARDLRAGDPVLLTGGAGSTPVATTVLLADEVVWYANAASDPAVAPTTNPLPIMHARLFLADAVNSAWAEPAISVAWGFGEVATLVDQTVDLWAGAPAALAAVGPAVFRPGSALPVQIEDANGQGVSVLATSYGDGAATLAGLAASPPLLTNPLRVLYDLLPVSRGKTVPDEVLGSGDARIPGQVFTLAKSPVTYLASGSGWASTVAVRVNGRPWREVGFFYGQNPDAEVFVTREDETGDTQVLFGDGINGARLPTGVNNIVATYRIGAGAESPPAGKLTVAANPFPGLTGVRNPVAVGGGADPEPASQVRRYAPRSVLTFGRAVSVLDYEALAAQAPGVTRARAVWAWDETRQRTAVTVYVGDNDAARDSADAALAAAGDPNRPISVVLATPLPTRLTLTLLVVTGMDAAGIVAAVVETLVGQDGLFSPTGLGVGQSVFDSAIAAAVLAVDGTVAILQSAFAVDLGWGFVDDPAPLHKCGEGAWFDLTADRVVIVPQAGGG